MSIRLTHRLAGMTLVYLAFASCQKAPDDRVQGYVEGEFVFVSSPLAGTLEHLSDAPVNPPPPAPPSPPSIKRRKTPPATRGPPRSFSGGEIVQQKKIFLCGPAGARGFPLKARSTRDQDRQRLAQGEWNLAQKKQDAPQAGLVYDTLFREGEWVAAGKPIVMLLPPPNIKVRAFVPEARVGALHPGDHARVFGRWRARAVRRQGELHFAAGRIHAAGHLQPGEPRQTRLHGRDRF